MALAAIMAAGQNETKEIATYKVGIWANASTGDFAPYYIGSLNHGRSERKNEALVDAGIFRAMDYGSRWSWGAGAELLGGYFSATDYAGKMYRPGAARLQQLYGEARYRSLFLEAGMKERGSALLNQELSSGDFVESGNARPIPQVRAGFSDFQDIPFTNGWMQIQGEVSYGKMADNGYLKDTYNYKSYHITLGSLYSYKRCYFRSNPDKPLSVTFGMQAASFFGGTAYYYHQGSVVREARFSKSLKTFLKVLLPMGENGEEYYTGSTLGSWDLRARYRLRGGAEISAYFQGPWEDGSGIGRYNKGDGLWGIEYKAANDGWLSGVVVEYLDFRDQSGPIHWDPADSPGTSVTGHVGGMDDYYNNQFYNAYANYGMSLGTPFLLSPVYNLNGYPAFACNRSNGFHVGAMGSVASAWRYVVKLGYQRGLGTYNHPYFKPRKNFSMMLQVKWDARAIMPGLAARAQVGFDSGELRGDNFGAALSIVYSGKILK